MKFVFITILFLSYLISFSQPANDDCSNATTLSCGTVNLAGTTNSTTNTTHGTGCSMSNYGVWYTFVGDGQVTTITVDADFDHEISISEGSCGSLNNVACEDAGTGIESYTFTSFSGTTYYIYIAHYSSSSSTTGDFTISRSCSPAPVNDYCSNATDLPCNTSNLSGTTIGTSDITHGTGCSMSNYGVWYTFTGDGIATTITVDAASGYDHELSISSGSCGSLTNVGCADGAGSGGNETYTFTPTNGVDYFIYIAHYTAGSSTTGDFTISRECFPPPTNDDCSGATSLTVNADHNCGVTTSGTLVDATQSAQSTSSCGGTENDDVWFSFVATNSAHMIDITNISGSTTDLYHSVWEGTCPSLSLVSGSCSDGDSQTVTGLTPGQTYYLRVYSYNGNSETTTFDVCISTPPANDDCSGAIALTVNSDHNCGVTTSGTLVDATQSAQSTSSCGGTENDDVWFSFVATNSAHMIDLTNVSGSTTDLYHSVWEGTCPSLSLVSGSCSDGNSQTVTGLTPGQTYYLRVYSYNGNSETTTFDICISTPPANDDCSGAIALTVNSDHNCGVTTSGTILDATQSAQNTSSCGGTENDDVWFSFVATNVVHMIDLTNISGSTSDLYHSLWEGTCPSLSLVSGSCSDPNSSTITGLTPGQTYYLRIYSYSSTSGQNTTFDICISTPPANDECSGAIPLTVNPDYVCTTMTSGTLVDATQSSNSTSCSGTNNDDVWFSFVATETGHRVSLHNISGSTTDMYHSVYSGSCGSLTEISCNDNNSTDLTGLTVGNTYYVRVYSWGSTNGQNTTFDVCVGTVPPQDPCGNPLPNSNDYCSYPATLTYDGGTWSSNTSSQYTDGTPGNLSSVFCGSIENNSWYQFTASNSTEIFNFTSVTNCENSDGIQAVVYDVTSDANGCCVDFTEMSNCWNPGTQTTGTVTATGLTVGNNYILMIDGYAGDDCDFTVDGWSASGILPVVISYFDGLPKDYYNKITWVTLSEINNNYFVLERSEDGVNFYEIKNVIGNGNSNKKQIYSIIDDNNISKNEYYRLKQVDFDGTTNYSKIISISNESSINNYSLFSENGKIKIIFDENIKENYYVMVADCSGRIIAKSTLSSSTESKSFVITNSKLANGVYNVIVYNNTHSESKKILMLNK